MIVKRGSAKIHILVTLVILNFDVIRYLCWTTQITLCVSFRWLRLYHTLCVPVCACMRLTLCVVIPLAVRVYFHVFIPVLPCWHKNTIPPWWEQKKGLVAGLKKSRQQQYKHTSYHTRSTGPVWCGKNHHIGWEAWQTVGRHAPAQHNPIAITSPGTLCTIELKRSSKCTLQNGFNSSNVNLTWCIIQFTLSI